MTDKVYNVLFICTGNSARSILAEAIANHRGDGRFRAYSAGSQPVGRVNPHAIELLARLGIPVDGLRSKSWDEFSGPGAPSFDFIFTVCDNAAGEACPVWLGHPQTAHWGVPDPAHVEGSELDKAAAFREAFRVLDHRFALLKNLPLGSLDRLALKSQLAAIGKSGQ